MLLLDKILPFQRQGQGFALRGEGLSQPMGKYPKDRRGTAQDERIRAHIRLSPGPPVTGVFSYSLMETFRRVEP